MADAVDLLRNPPEIPPKFLEKIKTKGEQKTLPEGWEKECLGAIEGQRNDKLTQLAGHCIGKKLSKELTRLTLMAANGTFSPPLPTNEVETILDSIWKIDSRKQTNDILTPIVCDGISPLNLKLPTFEEIGKLDIKVTWLVDGLLPELSITVVSAPGGLLKTMLCLKMGSCISIGAFFLNRNCRRLPVYYCDYENPLSLLAERARFLGPSPMMVWHLSNPFPPPRLDSESWILFKSLQPGLIIYDTLRSSQLLDENSSRDMALIMGRLKELREAGFTVLLIHHSPKADERKYKGSTAISDLADHCLVFERVRSAGSDELADDQEDQDLPLRLGVRGKTRFESAPLFMKFDRIHGFTKADDPNEILLLDMQSVLKKYHSESGNYPNQTQFLDAAKREMELSKKSLRRLLQRGLGRYWESTVGEKNSRFYQPIQFFPSAEKAEKNLFSLSEGKTGNEE